MAVGVRPQDDPMRNFKFHVKIDFPPLQSEVADMGFTNVAGINMTTEVINYREGGWNTNYHKLPANTDFGPLTLIQGVVRTRPGMWHIAKNMFAVQWGAGNGNGTGISAPAIGAAPAGPGPGQFRFTTTVKVLDHPITLNPGSGSPGDGDQGARLAFVFYQCWVGSVAFNDLDAAGNSVLISQMTMHHEGFDVFFDQDAVNA